MLSGPISPHLNIHSLFLHSDAILDGVVDGLREVRLGQIERLPVCHRRRQRHKGQERDGEQHRFSLRLYKLSQQSHQSTKTKTAQPAEVENNLFVSCLNLSDCDNQVQFLCDKSGLQVYASSQYCSLFILTF
jgi:hypothetical protein